ncbi:SDR family NAD(P)-dependent oxidoreductase [Rhodoplanes sp. Z2-YC6860]|uniref:SDR family NAD(P)-dependent oxidoreductase n=1 Tax=Rhodoplanes sp. Z2-YC6860 TaxID=674703 RepID=UPI00078DC10C|nr:SDR family NAD(P)-dependent oxidoreductase [Rhodoplanes sp. Z2-YC6860]AMN43186.1 3-oxoacyl-ACP reductase [Rhodoplanes sp. Z2-YC6860]
MDYGLQDKVIIITGAASGFGQAATRLLLKSKAKLVLADLNTQGLAAIAREASSAGVTFAECPLDVSSADETKAVVAQAVEKFGRIDGLLHFAGVIDIHSIEETTVAHWNRVININLLGTFLMAQAVSAVMKQQRQGRIVLTASDSARKGASISGPAYAASKGGVIALTRDLAMKLGPSGITVNAICPGIVQTPMVSNDAGIPAAALDEVIARTPLGRLGEPEDMAGTAIMLLTEATKFINGEIVEVNGGFFFD